MADHFIGVLYATMLHSESSKALLEAAVSAILKVAENGEGKLLYALYYEQNAMSPSSAATTPNSSLDLAFNDEILDRVEAEWKTILEIENRVEQAQFMQFDERNAMNEEDEDN